MEWFCQILSPEVWAWLRYPAGLIIGAAVSLGVGYLVVTAFYENQWKWLCQGWGEEIHPEKDTRHIRPSVMGCVERTIFTGFVALYPAAAITAMGAWLALKMATHWNRQLSEQKAEEQQKRSAFAMLGLLAGLLSMAFAALGGFLVRIIWGWPIG